MINQKATAILFLITGFYKENTIAFEPEGSEVNGVFDWQGQKDLNPQKSFTIKSYINTIVVFMRLYMILFFLQESKNTILIIKVCYKVCYFFAQKKPACLDWQAG